MIFLITKIDQQLSLINVNDFLSHDTTYFCFFLNKQHFEVTLVTKRFTAVPRVKFFLCLL